MVFSGCSSKEHFKPKNVTADWNHYGNNDYKLVGVASKIALLEDNKVLVGSKVFDVKIAQDSKLLGYSDGWVISANIDGKLTLQSLNNTKPEKHFNLKRTVAVASVKDDILAVLFANNKMALYSMTDKTLLLKEQGDAPLVVNSKIVAPYFKNDLVIFSTLDGKVVLINTKTKKKLRTVIVSSADNFNNVIYFNFLDNKIIASTGDKVLSLSSKELRVKYDIRNVVDDGENIYLSTKQGEIVSLTPDLQQNKKVKFPFAHFLGLIVNNDKLYALEKEGYIIEFTKDLQKYNIYEVDVEDGYIFVDAKKFHINDEYISVE